MASSTASSRAEIVDKYRRLRRKQRASTPTEAQSSFTDENRPTPSSASRATTPHRSNQNASPLSPKNHGASSFNTLKPTPSIPSRIRRDVLSNTEPSPLAAPSPFAVSTTISNSARRERLARHSKLLGNRGASGHSTPTTTTTHTTPLSTAAVTETPVTRSVVARGKYERPSKETPASSLSKYYSYEQPSSASHKKPLPPKTPSYTSEKKKKNVGSSSGSVCSMDPTEVSRRVRERRARGAKKLFILATSPTADAEGGGDHGNLTPLERHLSSHENDPGVAVDDCPSVVSDVSTLTMSTLSSLARDKRKFSRDRRFSSSKLYARATTGSTSTDEKTTPATPSRGRSPVRQRRPRSNEAKQSPPKERGTPVRSNSTKRALLPASGSRSITSGSDSAATPSSALNRRATTMQKAKRLARNRSRSVDRRTTSNSSSNTVEQRSSTPVTGPQERYASPSQYTPSQQSVSSSRTPMSVDSNASSTSRAVSRAASIQKARRTLARTKSQGRMKQAEPTPPPKVQNIPPVFAAREKVVAQARSLSMAPQTRRNLDKRTARLKYHNEFAMEVVKCQEERGLPPPKHVEGENLLHRSQNGVSIFVRKRPIFEYELEANDFDVVFTEAREDCDAVVIHSCVMHSDMRRMLVKPVAFPCSAAFDDWYSNDELYTHVGKPLVRLAANGGLATMLTYGQTGSGKTHTITGMEERVCKDIFRMINKSVQAKVQFVELAGKQVKDLLGDGDVKLVDQENGSVLLLNATSVNAQSSEELYGAILQGKRKRATESTNKNDASSRSHAVCQIIVTSTNNVSGLLVQR